MSCSIDDGVLPESGGRLTTSIFFPIAAALFGLLIGSFLNVCIYRIPRDLSVVFPRSFCPECGQTIRWYDNVPVLSYVLLGGRCRSCGKLIGYRYVLVEIGTAALFAAVAVRYGLSWTALKWATVEALATVMFWTDLEERILPDELTLGGAAAGLIFAFFVPLPSLTDLLFESMPAGVRSILNGAMAALFFGGLFWAVARLYSLLRGREGLGLGDIKLLLFIGAFFGLERGLLVLLIGAASGALLGVVAAVAGKKDFGSYELPFGTFLCLGAAIVALSGQIDPRT